MGRGPYPIPRKPDSGCSERSIFSFFDFFHVFTQPRSRAAGTVVTSSPSSTIGSNRPQSDIVKASEENAMAAWQYDLFLVGEGHALPLWMDDGWELPQLPAASTLDAQGTLAGSMRYPWLMMDDWIVFGNEESTRIDLMFNEADEVDEVEIRIRLSASATEAELDAVCCFAREVHGKLFDPATGALLQPDRSSLASALASSRAAAFSRSPQPFLAGQSEA
jgi:hypothetical protein